MSVHPRWRGEQFVAPPTSKRSTIPVHPRWRGEQCGCAERGPTEYGSSRWRGEQASGLMSLRGSIGSSPLARGTGDRGAHALVDAHGRFIPAGAGNSPSQILDAFLLPKVGSSPLARGTGYSLPVLSGLQVARFIPAGAGNSSTDGLPGILHFGSSPLARGTGPHL